MDLQAAFFLILPLFVLFQIKHFVLDFLAVNYYKVQADLPARTYIILTIHSMAHTIGTFAVLAGYLTFAEISQEQAVYVLAALLAAGDGIIHFIIDYTTVITGRRLGELSFEKDKFKWVFGIDQLAHQLTYIGIITILVVLLS